MPTELHRLSHEIAERLLQRQESLVLAESCTAGLISATLSRIPGVSRVLAGSAVVYQLETKTAWLDVPPEILENPGAVSRETAEAMVLGALAHTPHASIAASVTGHLGPGAPPDLDGTAWCAVCRRGKKPQSIHLHLESDRTPPLPVDELAVRHSRQLDAVRQVLEFLLAQLPTE